MFFAQRCPAILRCARQRVGRKLEPLTNQREGIVKFTEYLQFLAMMLPTLLLLAAVAVSLAFPTQSLGALPMAGG